MGRTLAALTAAILACLIWTRRRGRRRPSPPRLPEGHARRQHAEPDGARRRSRRPRLLHRARRAAEDLEARHAADGHRRARSRSRAARRTACSASQLAPDFAFSKWVYLFYSQLPDNTRTQVVSRFKMNGDTLDLSSEQRILTFQHQTRPVLPLLRLAVLRPRRQPLHLDGRQHQPVRLRRLRPDRRAARPRVLGRAAHRGQHQRPQRQDPAHQADGDPDGPPGVGTTYTIPAGNLFAERHGDKTRPEIFGMGFRNPFRFTVDQTTGWVLIGDYGPDAGTTNANRGPQGSVEFNVLTKAGQLWLAVLHPRQRRLQRLRLRHQGLGRQVQLRRAGQRLARTTRA